MPTPSDPKPAPEEIAREAAGIIASAPGYGPLRPVEYAKELPPRAAALASVLMDEKIDEAAGQYQTCDAAAGKAQQRFKHWGWLAAYSGFLAAGLGGGLLYLGPEPSMAWARSNLGLAQSILLGLSLVFAFLLYVLKPYRKWRVQRGDAEAKRLQVFALMMSDRGTVTGGDPLLLPLQLECFLRTSSSTSAHSSRAEAGSNA